MVAVLDLSIQAILDGAKVVCHGFVESEDRIYDCTEFHKDLAQDRYYPSAKRSPALYRYYLYQPLFQSISWSVGVAFKVTAAV